MTSDSPILTATDMHGVSSVREHTERGMLAKSGLWRAWHQLAHEWRFQRGVVLLDWLLLAGACWETLRETARSEILPAQLPAVLALVIIARSVRADAPENAEAVSHTRPLGRAAVWAGKAGFFVLALLLPWVLHALPQYAGYGFGTVEWLALAVQTLVPAALLGGMAACLISLASTRRQNIGMTLVAFVLAFALALVLEETWSDVERCGLCVAGGGLLVALLAAWWWQSARLRPRVAWLWMLGGLGCACVLPQVWAWNWRALPPLGYEGAKLALEVGAAPQGEGPVQTLWPRLHLRGLPVDHVAAVVAFAPVPEKGAKWPPSEVISSDYTAVLARHYPPQSLWHGNPVDGVRGPGLAEILEAARKTDPQAAEKPWRLRLAVQRMQRVFHLPMREAMRGGHSISPEKGHRLDFRLEAADSQNNGGSVDFTGILRRRFPLLVAEGRHAKMRPMGYVPMQNFIAVMHSPALAEARVAQESSSSFSYRDSLLLGRHDRPADFDFPHPGPQMDMTGLTLEEWLGESTLDVWWAEERGTIDLEVSVEELRRVLGEG